MRPHGTPPLRLLAPLVLAFLLGATAVAAEAAEEPVPPPIHVTRATGPITVDGKLDDPGWQGAATIDRFYETFPGENTEPTVKTVVYLTYDDVAFYIGVHAYDPHPEQIRAPFVARDSVLGTDDNIAVFLDTRDDRRSALELRVNPRGIQGDASYNDANGNEDFSPDYFYDTAAQITADGWTAEYRIPFSSLRYEKQAEVKWNILVWRNYPRDQRYAFHSSPIPRQSNCWICRAREIDGLVGLPPGGHYVAAPYATGQRLGQPTGRLGSTLADREHGNAGADVKWTPTASNAVDATIRPDFSQVESDVGQIDVNNQFALFYPEKRPFFLESIDLFDTPLQAVYTRTINDPQWGLRDTGKLGATSFTALLTEDRGGGLAIIPGPTSNDFALRDFSSEVFIGRARHDFGESYVGLLATARQNDRAAGGYNRLVGPDFLWRWSGTDQVTGQFLYSATQTPDRPDLYPTWDGESLSSHAAHLEWLHTARDWTWRLTAQDIGDDFRADEGFVTQTGIRLGRAALYRNLYTTAPFFRVVQPYLLERHLDDQHGQTVQQVAVAGVQLMGSHNLFFSAEIDPREELLVQGRELYRTRALVSFQIDPGARISRIGFNGTFGDEIDFENARQGTGTQLNLFGTLKPTIHLSLDWTTTRQWVDVDPAGPARGRLFTAQIERLNATYNFTARSFLRLIGQYLDVDRRPDLYTFAVPDQSGGFNGSALLAYRLNWQTVAYVGYGDDRLLDPVGALLRQDRSFFFKISYAFQG